jgi:hypothetical protein
VASQPSSAGLGSQADHTTATSGDPLPSWSEPAAKASIIRCSCATTDPASADCVRPETPTARCARCCNGRPALKLAEPLEACMFSPAGASVYHLGSFGTARSELKALPLLT